MKAFILSKDQLSPFIEGLMRTYRVIAPVERQGELRFEPLRAAAEVVLRYRNTRKAPKAALFPQSECMVRFGWALDQFNAIEASPLDTTPTVLLGLRPCDARGMLLLDRVLGEGQYCDPYYAARRNNTLVFSLACDRPRATCFCHVLGSGPYDAEGADVLLREAGDVYVLDAVSARGEAVLATLSLPSADAIHLAEAAAVEQQARERLVPAQSFVGIEESLHPLFEHKLWAEVSEKCLACGTCTYVCPECHCFNIEDRALAQGGERVRAWDSCMYPIFTQHASGHNPRPDQAARWRQRIMHKFDYLPRNVGRYGCVGCGRCIVSCPVRLDIRDVLRRVYQEAEIQAAASAVAQETQP